MLKDFVQESVNAPGTGSFTLGGAASGRVTFASQFSNGDQLYYFADDGAGNAEAGIGTLTTGSPNTLSRDTVLWRSTGGTSKANFTGTIRVYSFVPSSRATFLNASQQLQLPVAAADAGDTPNYGQIGWHVLSQVTISTAVANKVFALDSGHTRFRLQWEKLAPAIADAPCAVFSTDGGSTYHAGSTDYGWIGAQFRFGDMLSFGATEAQIQLGPFWTGNMLGSFELQNEATIAGNADAWCISVTGPAESRWSGGGHATFSGPATHLRIQNVSGSNFTGGRLTLLGRF